MNTDPRVLETLDEAIDRVAASMTAVPANPLLADRIVRELNDRRGSIWTLIPAAAAITALVAAVAWSVFDRSSAVPSTASTTAEVAAPAIAPTPSVVSVDQQTANNVAPPRIRVRRAPQAVFLDEESPVRQIDALSEVSSIAIDELPNDLLTIAPVQVAPLDLASLEVNEMKGDDPPREQ